MSDPDREKLREAKLTESRALNRQVKAAEAKLNLLDYIEFTMPDPDDPNDVNMSAYKTAKHHRAICNDVQKFVEGGFPGYDILVLEAPPRHGKSEIVSRRLPAWYSGKYPRQNIVVATYNDAFAADFGAEVRTIIKTQQHKTVFPGHYLITGGTAKDRLQTNSGGLMAFVGRGGSLTGRGAHLLVLDDLIKGDDEARSPAIRDAAWAWLTRVAMTRLMGRKLTILMGTRWHEDDPTGRLTDPKNEHYVEEIAKAIKVITLPALAGQDDVLGRKPGEALWPDGPDTFNEVFLRKRQLVDPIGFSALYQQRPTVEDGILFRRENIHTYRPDELPANLRFYCASDHSVTTGQRSDPTCMIKVGLDDANRIWILPNVFWKKATTDVVVEAMLLMGSGAQAPLVWWAEKGHITGSIGPFLRKRMLETERWFNLVEVPPSADKERRAQSISARMAQGLVLFPAGAWWTEDAIQQLLAFPNGNHDDFVDAMAYIGMGLQVQVAAGTPVAQKPTARYGSFAHLKEQQRRSSARMSLGGRGGF